MLSLWIALFRFALCQKHGELGRRNDRVALAIKSCKDYRGVVFLDEEKMVNWEFGGAARPLKQTPGSRLQARTLKPDLRAWQQPKKWTPGARASQLWGVGVALLCFKSTIAVRDITSFAKSYWVWVQLGSQTQHGPKTLPKGASRVGSCCPAAPNSVRSDSNTSKWGWVWMPSQTHWSWVWLGSKTKDIIICIINILNFIINNIINIIICIINIIFLL